MIPPWSYVQNIYQRGKWWLIDWELTGWKPIVIPNWWRHSSATIQYMNNYYSYVFFLILLFNIMFLEAPFYRAQLYDWSKCWSVCNVDTESDAGQSNHITGTIQSVFRHVDWWCQWHSSLEWLSIIKTMTNALTVAYSTLFFASCISYSDKNFLDL